MEYVLLIKDQLQVFLGSLQDLLAGKHDIVRISFPPMVDIQLVEGLEEEVVREKLETSPNFKVGEYGIQLRFVQKDKIIGIHGFCLKNFSWPDEPNNARWGKIYVQLASLQKNNEKLCKGLEKRHIQMGLTKEYVRKVGRKDNNTYYCSFVKAGQGFKVDHWHHDVDVERIIKVRIDRHKQGCADWGGVGGATLPHFFSKH